MNVYRKTIHITVYVPETAEDCERISCTACFYETEVNCGSRWEGSETP